MADDAGAGGEIDLAGLADDALVSQMHDDLYDGLADEIAEGTNLLLARKLETKNTGAFDFLKKMKWTNDDQNQVTKYKNVDGMTIEAAAQKWVDANPTVWQAWLS